MPDDRARTLPELRAIDIAKTLARRADQGVVDEMVVLYRNGDTQSSIARTLMTDEVEKSRKVACGAVGLILQQNMPADELETIRHERRVESGVILGDLSAKGIHGFCSLPEEERHRVSDLGRAELARRIGKGELDRKVFVAAGHKGGMRAAEVHRQNGTGVFGMSFEERRRIGRQNGTKMKESRRGIFRPEERTPEKMQARADQMLAKTGKQRISGEEKARLMQLASSHEGAQATILPSIQATLRDEFGIGRTVSAIRSAIYRERKKIALPK